MVKDQDDKRQDYGFPDEFESEPESDWFFDLPAGAWERQEEKNRDLRRRLLEQTGHHKEPTPATTDVAADELERVEEVADAPVAETRRRRWGLGKQRKKAAIEPERSVEDNDVADSPWDDEAEEWDFVPPPHFEAENKWEAAVESEPSVEDDDVAESPWDDEAEESDFVPPPRLEPEAEWDTAVEPSTSPAEFTVLDDHRDVVDEDSQHEETVAAPLSKWDEALAASKGSGSIIDGMREWSEKSKAAAEVEGSGSFPDIDFTADVVPIDGAAAAEEANEPDDERDDEWVVELLEADEQVPEPLVDERGFFARVFRRGEKDSFDENETLEAAKEAPDWAPEEPTSEAAAIAGTDEPMSEKDPWAEFLRDADDEPDDLAAPIEPLETVPAEEAEEAAASLDVVIGDGDEHPAEPSPDMERQDEPLAVEPPLSLVEDSDNDASGRATAFESEAPGNIFASENRDDSLGEEVAWDDAADSGQDDPDTGAEQGAAAKTSAASDVPETSHEDAVEAEVFESADPAATSKEELRDDTADLGDAEESATRDPWDVIAALGEELEREGGASEPGVILGPTGAGFRAREKTPASPPLDEDIVGGPAEGDEDAETEDAHEDSGWQLANAVNAEASDDDDVVLRAFDAHASTADDPAEETLKSEFEQEDSADFNDLLDDDSETMVFMPMDASSDDGRPFGQAAWAPQRSVDVFDGEQVSEYADQEPTSSRRSDKESDDGDGDNRPPWETDGNGRSGGGSGSGSARTKTLVRELVETGLLALLVFLAVRASFQNFKVEGESMFPTLEDGQYIIVNKLAYSEVDMDKLNDFVPFISAEEGEEQYVFTGPERGTIIVFMSPRDPSEDLIKRIIGLPGETIEIVDGHVYVNGFRLEEPYTNGEWTGNYPRVLIGPDEYFVMGDNRQNSQDSRSAGVGLVHKDLIIGKAMVSYWPRSQVGLAPNGGAELTDERVPVSAAKVSD